MPNSANRKLWRAFEKEFGIGASLCGFHMHLLPHASIADPTAVPPDQFLWLLPETFVFAQNGNRTEQISSWERHLQRNLESERTSADSINDSTAILSSQILLLQQETFEVAHNGSRTGQIRGSKATLENDCRLDEKPLKLSRTVAELSKSIGRITFCKYKFRRRQETFELAQKSSRIMEIVSWEEHLQRMLTSERTSSDSTCIYSWFRSNSPSQLPLLAPETFEFAQTGSRTEQRNLDPERTFADFTYIYCWFHSNSP